MSSNLQELPHQQGSNGNQAQNRPRDLSARYKKLVGFSSPTSAGGSELLAPPFWSVESTVGVAN